MGTITYKTEDSATTPNPPSGSVQTGVDYTAGEPYYKDSAGVVHSLKGAKGDTGSQGPKGDTGPQGPDGTDGADGAAATISVGTTTTGAAGTDADVSNSGTSSAAVFDFVIPEGEQGTQGPKGDAGDQGTPGTDGTDGTNGTDGADGHILGVHNLGSITGAVTIDLADGYVFTGTLTGDITITWASLPASGTMQEITLVLTQDATGAHAITWPGTVLWPGGYAFTGGSPASQVDEVGIRLDSAGNGHAYPVEAME